MVDPHHFNSWYLVGVASRVLVDLGLHQSASQSLQTRYADFELGLRIYDCVYALDR